MNRLKGFEKLMRRMKETGLVFGRKLTEILQAQSPDARHLGILHEGISHVAKRRGGGVLGSYLGDPGATMNLNGKVKHGQHNRDGTDKL